MNRFQDLFSTADCRDLDPQLSAPALTKITLASNEDGTDAPDWFENFLEKRQRAVLGIPGSFTDELTIAKSASSFIRNQFGKILPTDLAKFVPFVKVDSVKREVSGVVTAEQPDRDGEICDYEKSKPYYQAWSDGFKKTTNGASLGNLREMHQLSAVGKALDLEFKDQEKEIVMTFKVIDDAAWEKVEQRVYTGFSQGGKKVEQYPDPGRPTYQRYVASPSEVSLVDNPCLPSARFAYVKADGSIEMRKFLKVAEAASLAKAAKPKDGDEVEVIDDVQWTRTRRNGQLVALAARNLAHGNSPPTYFDAKARRIGAVEYQRLVAGSAPTKVEFPRSSDKFVTKILGATDELMVGSDPLGRW
jgi:hypothetical protein